MTIRNHGSVLSCKEFRQSAGADPQNIDAAANEHRDQCPACADYLKQMLDLDNLLERALQLPIAPPVVVSTAPPPHSKWFALAASLVLSFSIATGIWLATPQTTLAADLADHMYLERSAMIKTSDRVSSEDTAAVLRKGGVRLITSNHVISFAKICPFHGEGVPHLVVQTAEGPVTVMVFSRQHVTQKQTFDEQGYHGTIMPLGKGSIAIIANNEAAINEAASKIAASIEWVA